MTVKEFLDVSEGMFQIAFYEYDIFTEPICYTKSNWIGVEPYLDREIGYFEFSHSRRDYYSGDVVYQVDIHFAKKGD